MLFPVDCNLSKNITILSKIYFIINVVNRRGKRGRGSGREGYSKSESIPVIPGHLSCMKFIQVAFETLISSIHSFAISWHHKVMAGTYSSKLYV